MRAPRWWLTAVAGLAVLLGAAGVPVIVASGRFTDPGLTIAVGLLIAWSFAGVGLHAWAHRPDNRIGALMTAVGFAWLASGLWLVKLAVLHTVGLLTMGLYYAVLIHMLLAFPSGRVSRRLGRAIVAASYAVAVIGQLAAMPFLASAPMLRCDCAANLLLVHRDDRLASGLLSVPKLAGVGLTLAVAWLLLRRWRAARRPERRALAPVLCAGAVVAALSAVNFAASVGGAPTGLDASLQLLALLALLSVPYAFVAGLARASFFHSGAVSALLARLAGHPGDGQLRETLAAALGDETVEVCYWLPERGVFADQQGRTVDGPPSGRPGRAVTHIQRDGTLIGAIICDETLAGEPRLVRDVAGATALAMENERLHAELRARVAELERSRALVVEAAELERRRLERNLHDGAQQRLVALRLTLGLLAEQARGADCRHPFGSARAELDHALAELDHALAELRELARGLHPAVLANRGLGAAVRSLTGRSPVPVRLTGLPARRLPAEVETAAYYVVAESLTNVAKHAKASVATVHFECRADRLRVEIRDDGVGGADPGGAGLRGLTARVEALDGRLFVTCAEGGGTLVRAEVPLCG